MTHESPTACPYITDSVLEAKRQMLDAVGAQDAK